MKHDQIDITNSVHRQRILDVAKMNKRGFINACGAACHYENFIVRKEGEISAKKQALKSMISELEKIEDEMGFYRGAIGNNSTSIVSHALRKMAEPIRKKRMTYSEIVALKIRQILLSQVLWELSDEERFRKKVLLHVARFRLGEDKGSGIEELIRFYGMNKTYGTFIRNIVKQYKTENLAVKTIKELGNQLDCNDRHAIARFIRITVAELLPFENYPNPETAEVVSVFEKNKLLVNHGKEFVINKLCKQFGNFVEEGLQDVMMDGLNKYDGQMTDEPSLELELLKINEIVLENDIEDFKKTILNEGQNLLEIVGVDNKAEMLKKLIQKTREKIDSMFKRFEGTNTRYLVWCSEVKEIAQNALLDLINATTGENERKEFILFTQNSKP